MRPSIQISPMIPEIYMLSIRGALPPCITSVVNPQDILAGFGSTKFVSDSEYNLDTDSTIDILKRKFSNEWNTNGFLYFH
jgi:hypothetical protein